MRRLIPSYSEVGSQTGPHGDKKGSAMLQVCSVYSQLLQLFSRGEFARAVKHHQAERNAKGFSSWEQFVAMLFFQLAHLNSLREVCMGLASCESPLKHLGISTTPKKSTLAYANANRPWELYESIFMQLLEKSQMETAAHSRRKFRFKNKLMSLDGSIIELSATMFDWAKYSQQKGAIKLHLLLDHDGYLPTFAVVTEGKYSEFGSERVAVPSSTNRRIRQLRGHTHVDRRHLSSCSELLFSSIRDLATADGIWEACASVGNVASASSSLASSPSDDHAPFFRLTSE